MNQAAPSSQLDRAVLALREDALPRMERFLAEIAAPAGVGVGDDVGIVRCEAWTHEGDHLRLDVAIRGAPADFSLLLRHHDPSHDAFLRTPRWNLSYRGQAFDRVTEALIREAAKRLEAVAAGAGLEASTLAERFFRRPEAKDFLEITSGKKLYLRVTDHCDENCVFCNATEGNANIVGSKRQLRDILDRLPTSALSQIIFSGGEPTLLRALPEMVGLAYERGARDIIIQTNGFRLAAAGALEAYLPYRDRLGIGFSLHALEASASDLLTGAHAVPSVPLSDRFATPAALPDPATFRSNTGRLAAKLAAIDHAVALGFRVKITCVVMRPNLDGVEAFAEACWARWGGRLDRLQFSYAMPRGNAWLNPQWALSFTECREPFIAAFALGRRTGMRVETSQSASMPPCVIPDWIDHLDVYGDFGAGAVAGPERVKPPALCAGCAFDRICPGVWTRYLEVFGPDEIVAVRDRPPPDVVLDDFGPGDVLDLAPR